MTDMRVPASDVADLRASADRGWEVMEASGQGGRSYEVRVTFRLPHVDGGDLLGYALEDQIVRLVGEAGGREATSQIQALGALQAP